MPTYEYACTACEDRLEVVQKFSDDPLTECPSCQGKLRKVFSPVGVVFKGSGFYRTDSRGSGNGSAKRDSASSSKSGDGAKDTSAKDSGSGEKSSGKDSSASTSSKSGDTGTSSGGSKEKVA